ncbi:hypothetical protein M5K25_023876 [Dendrobium thyrsiflorum]|uniref:Uncharacterized protein n=1 Tax=Dendrobium thyrsiflorum TaxID=117978 RepID=A0ABD0U0R1_DENTH
MPSHVRARDVGPDLHHIKAPRPSRKHSASRHAEPSCASIDQTASYVPKHFLTLEDVLVGPRMSMNVPFLFRDSREDIQGPRMSDFTGYSAPDPFTEFSFQVDLHGSFWPGEPSRVGSFWPGESSGAGVASPTKLPDMPSYTHTILELALVATTAYLEANPADSTSSSSSFPAVPEGADYVSEIRWHAPIALKPWHIARLGLKGSEMLYWETLCRKAEFHIRRLQPLSILRTRVSLPELQEKVVGHRAAVDVAHDQFNKSIEALKRHCQSSSSMAGEIERLTSRVKDLWRDIKQVMSQKSDLQEGHDRRDRLIKREQLRNEMLHQALLAAKTALTQAVKELHAVEVEYQTLVEIVSQLGDL